MKRIGCATRRHLSAWFLALLVALAGAHAIGAETSPAAPGTPDEEPTLDPSDGTGTGEETDALGVTVAVDGPWVRARFASSPAPDRRTTGSPATRP